MPGRRSTMRVLDGGGKRAIAHDDVRDELPRESNEIDVTRCSIRWYGHEEPSPWGCGSRSPSGMVLDRSDDRFETRRRRSQ